MGTHYHTVINARKLSKLPLIQMQFPLGIPNARRKVYNPTQKIIQAITGEQPQLQKHRARKKRSNLQLHSNWLLWSQMAG